MVGRSIQEEEMSAGDTGAGADIPGLTVTFAEVLEEALELPEDVLDGFLGPLGEAGDQFLGMRKELMPLRPVMSCGFFGHFDLLDGGLEFRFDVLEHRMVARDCSGRHCLSFPRSLMEGTAHYGVK